MGLVVFLITFTGSIYRPKAEPVFEPEILKEGSPVVVWVFFTDKGFTEEKDLSRVLHLSRSKDFDDIPTPDDYIAVIEDLGGVLRHRSKWLNGASFWILPDMIPKIGSLPFVSKIKKIDMKPIRANPYPLAPTGEPDSSYYGYTYLQNKMFNIDMVHNLGIYGSGIRIGILDTGFKRKHSALTGVKIAGEHDFLSGDHLFRYQEPAGIEELFIRPFPSIRGLTGTAIGDTVELFFISDTIFSSYWPTREVLEVYTTGGNLWTGPFELSNTHSDLTYTDGPAVAGTDTIELVWSTHYRYGGYSLYHCRGKMGSWTDKTIITSSIGSIRNPHLTIKGDSVLLTYVYADSSLLLRFYHHSWLPGSTLVFKSNHKLYNPSGVSSGDTIIITANSMFPDSIYLSISSDGGSRFTTRPVFPGNAPVLKIKDDTLYLLFKQKNGTDCRLLLTKSSDHGQTWDNPITITSEASIGRTDLTVMPEVMITYQSYGDIYLAQEPDWQVKVIDTCMVYWPKFIGPHLYYLRRGDDDTDYDPLTDREDQPDHGTRMLGLIGGLAPNLYIGVAYGANFLIAKTERIGLKGGTGQYEFPVEEDTWIEGLEWLEKNGAKIVSSSLAYIDWYDYEDLDGRTAPISVAAHKAAERGMVIVNAIGNRGDTLSPTPYITAPGDADGVITVGGVQPDSSFARIAGFGPTVDGRMKPELSALAASWLEEQKGVVVINPDSISEYLFSSGTSTATALVAGICALVLEGHPNWNGDSLRKALFETASLASNPSESLGYGLPDAYAALYYSPPILDSLTTTQFLPPYPNPFIPDQHQYIYLPFFVALTRIRPTLSIYSLDGRLIHHQKRDNLLTPGVYDKKDQNLPDAAFRWDGRDENGNQVRSGVYIAVMHNGFGAARCKFAIIR